MICVKHDIPLVCIAKSPTGIKYSCEPYCPECRKSEIDDTFDPVSQIDKSLIDALREPIL